MKEEAHMHTACPFSELAPGKAIRLNTSPPLAVIHTKAGGISAPDGMCTHQDSFVADGWVENRSVDGPLHSSGFTLRTGSVDAPPANLPANLPVRSHEVTVIDGDIMITESTEAPNLPPRLTVDGHVRHQRMNPNQRTCSWL
ncbi:Rieske 2Fe-2S domain-containing protein [Arthrobacter sp. HMWF013]|uniref:Rieske 2Fe-2S domain-containing protein n=1 Tax=Arthrobacter sp. HMWF013 TaxID=2056849 RepID=UPI0026999A41|nr:Rieske 2Fe-2S domain-containing protein [Arthrobacter sp. HMWF013]